MNGNSGQIDQDNLFQGVFGRLGWVDIKGKKHPRQIFFETGSFGHDASMELVTDHYPRG
jgi:hypothetical protein